MTLALASPLLDQIYPDLRPHEIQDILEETWKARPFSYEPFTQFKEREFKGRFVNVDQNGFRVSKNQGVWPPDPDSYNVFLFGGSTTFGYGVPDDQTIASYLQDTLQTKMHKEVRVYNFGRGFYYWFQERVLFERLLRSGYSPDMAIFIDGYNGSIFNTCDELFYTPMLGKVLTSETRPDFFTKLMRKLSLVFNSMPVTTFAKISILEITSRSPKKGAINGYVLKRKLLRLLLPPIT